MAEASSSFSASSLVTSTNRGGTTPVTGEHGRVEALLHEQNQQVGR